MNSSHARWWEYQAIRDHDYKTYKQYLNLFCFHFLDFDSRADCLRMLSRWLFPNKSAVAFECGVDAEEHSLGTAYFKLYRQRGAQLIHSISEKMPLLKRTKTL